MDKSVLVLVCALAVGTLQVCDGREIILNEDTLLDTCTGTCGEIPNLYDREGCKKISGCQKSSEGWNRGFVRCDYCKCTCDVDTADKDIMVEQKKLSITEPDLLGTCTKTCDKSGLVRTNSNGCQEIRDCYRERKGWNRGFVRCDYCTCDCINRKSASEYTIRNIKYDLTQIDEENGAPKGLAETIVENSRKTEQKASRTLTFTTTRTTSVETSKSLEIGLTVTVGATAGIPEVVGGSTEVSTSLTSGFTYTAGSSVEKTKEDSVTAEVNVPPHSSVRVIVSGQTVKIDVPFTADEVTTYEDRSTSTKQISGIYKDVETTRFIVKYEPAKPLKA